MVLAIAMPGTGGLTDEFFNEVRERGALFAASESSSSASTTTNMRCSSSSIRNRSRSPRRERLVNQAKGTIAGLVGPCIANASNDEDRVPPVAPCMRAESDDPVCSLFNVLLYFVRHHNKELQMQKNVIERLCEVTQAQHAALLDVKKLVMDIHNDLFLRRNREPC